MGSQTPEGHRRGPADAAAKAAITSIDPPKSSAANGLLEDALGGEATDDDDEFDGSDLKVDIKITNDESNLCLNALSQGQSVGKKKRKRSRNKKKMGSAVRQTRPPRVALSDVFKHQPFPEGQVVDYANRDENLQRTTNEELRHLSVVDNMDDQFFSDYRKAAETHRQVRQYVQAIAKPGITMSKLADEIEDGVRALVGHQATTSGDALEAGMGFPTGLCLNNVAAHWTPNPGGKEVVLQYDDVLSIDFGVHVNGRIVDSAFTIAHNPIYDNLLEGVKAATNTGLKMAGIDARISELSAEMQEVMESHEVTLNGKTIPIRAINNITGHNILRYKIHGDKQVPFVKSRTTQRMEEGDIFAIETFGSTGRGSIRDGVGVYGYGRNEGVSAKGLHHGSAKALLKTIEENFGTLVFSKRYLERVGAKNYHLGMKTLVAAGVVEQYGPLVDIPGSYVAQFEHTVLLRPNCKEIISRGDDY